MKRNSLVQALPLVGWLVLRGATRLCAADPLAVLCLEEADSLRPAYSSFIGGLRQGLARRYPGRINLYTENLDLPRFDRPGYRAEVGAWLRKKYQGVRLDAVVALGDQGSKWVLQMRQEGWADIPVVLIGGLQTNVAPALPSRTTRVEVRLEARQTLELAWRLWPRAKRVVILGATVSGYARVNQQLDAQFQEFTTAHGLELRRLSGLTMAEYRQQAAAIPPDSLIYYLGLSVDAAGVYVGPREALAELGPLLQAPVFVATETYLGHGAAGGACYQFSALGDEVGRLVVAALRDPGSNATNATASAPDCTRVMLDGRQLRRFGIPRGRVPAGADVLFEPPSLWQNHRTVILLVSGALLAQTLTIGGLLLQRRRLRESRERWRLLVAASFEGIAISEQGRLTEVNDQLVEMLGYRREELIGVELASLFSAEHRAQIAAGMAEGRPVRAEHELVRKDGTRLPVAIQGRSGTCHHHPVRFSALRDLTESQRAARELQAHRDQLAHAERVSTLGLLASSLAHELTQPLTASLQNAETAEIILQNHPVRYEEILAIVRDIKANDLRAAKVIASMRALLVRQEVEFKPQDLAAILRETVELVRPDAAQRGVVIREEMSASLGRVYGDRVQLQQVVLNLLLNAMQALGAVPAGERTILVCARQHFDGGARVEVTDSGPGLPAASKPHLFEPFFSTKPSGLGIGLAISRRIMESHLGYLGAENNPQGGATFWIELPEVSTL